MHLLVLILALVGAGSTSDCTDHPGKFQSPINIDTEKVVNQNVGQVQFSQGYNELPTKMTITSNGHTFNVEVKTKSPLQVTFPMYPVKYDFLQLHFHWGENHLKGSEHTINNNSYPLEMHVVHAQTENSNYPKYIVIGHFFSLTRKINTGLLAMVPSMLESAHKPGVAVKMQSVRLSQFFPVGSFPYYTYEGSLTTPPFLESVRWVVAKNPIILTKYQLAVFWASAEIEPGMYNNYRCVQELEGREVMFNP